ncbi:subtilisin-like protein [Trametes meyenii]|nr:subtilisin-like protein [Trametes meyenii]
MLQVSDPASPSYGQHLSKPQMAQYVAPEAESVKVVTDWLAQYGITPQPSSPFGDMLDIDVSLDQANALFNANFTPYPHGLSNATEWRTPSYRVPADVQPHLLFIYPTTRLIPRPTSRATMQNIAKSANPPKRQLSKRARAPSHCAETMTPRCLQALYNIPSTVAESHGTNNLVVVNSEGEVANSEDLKIFLAQERPDITNGTFTTLSIGNATVNDRGMSGALASLSIEYSVGLASNVPTTLISMGQKSKDSVRMLMEVIDTLLEQDDSPRVLSMDLGWDEDAFEQIPEVAHSLCNRFMQLGARGTSVIFPAGDLKADAYNSGSSRIAFPASCPYVTTVGGTQGVDLETVAPFSVGGFSNIFLRPDYQRQAITSYLSTQVDNCSTTRNVTGRAYPDVSAQGMNFAVRVNGLPQRMSGTVASATTFASIIALLNDRLLSAGKSPLGFLNPLLYSRGAAAFNAIITNVTSNSSCVKDSGSQSEGRSVDSEHSTAPVGSGWDTATGLGTLDFQRLLAIVVAPTKT